MNAPVLTVTSLTKRYGDTTAVDALALTVGTHEIVGLLGPNGAGKTSTINMILGILKPTAGTILVNGLDIVKHRRQVLAFTNFAAVYAPLPGNVTVYQNLQVFAMLYGIRKPARKIAELLERFEITRLRNTKCGVLSSGEQTRVSLAKALLNDPALLLLDEPTASLDPSIALDIRLTLRDYARRTGAAVLWTSHNMHEVASVCDRVLFIARGSIILEGDPKTLPHQYGTANLEELFIAVAHERITPERG